MASAVDVQRLPVMLRLALAAGLGLLAALGQEPYNIPVVMLASMAAIFAIFQSDRRPGSAALTGLAYGWGYFALAMIWIQQPFRIEPEVYGWMAPFAWLLLSFGLALFWAIAFWLARRGGPESWPLIFTWAGAELLRAYLFTGFPWASPPQALVGAQAGQSLAWVGPHGLMLGLCAVAWALARPSEGRIVALAGKVALVAASVALLLLPPSAPVDGATGRIVRIVQPNAPQQEKWDPDKAMGFFSRQLEFTSPPLEGGGRPDLVVWPETAIPWFLQDAGPAFSHIAFAADGSPVILGLNRYDGNRLFNALVVLDAQGDPVQTYDKHHIVPFGEYVPLGDLLGRFGIEGMAQRDGDGFSRGPGPRLLDLGPLGRALPLICYEAVFAQDVGAAPERPDLLVQITNDAWFGIDVGPQQHLAQARMRAIEQGLPLVRSANTGISAMVDPYGRVIDSLPLGRAGYIDAQMPAPLAPTIYSQSGDLPAGAIVLAGLAIAIWRRRRQCS
ncbi:apolipoprotein N-acyltransferase [Sulfitobacter sp. LCG007]